MVLPFRRRAVNIQTYYQVLGLFKKLQVRELSVAIYFFASIIQIRTDLIKIKYLRGRSRQTFDNNRSITRHQKNKTAGKLCRLQ